MWYAAHARLWQQAILDARKQARGCSHFLEVRYEDLLPNTRPVLERQAWAPAENPAVLRRSKIPPPLCYRPRPDQSAANHRVGREPVSNIGFSISQEVPYPALSLATSGQQILRVFRVPHAKEGRHASTIGMSRHAGSALNRRITSSPPVSGRWTSSRIRSGLSARALAWLARSARCLARRSGGERYVEQVRPGGHVFAAEPSDNFPSAAYHAGLNAEHCKRVREQLLDGKIAVVVATIAFGSPLDGPLGRQCGVRAAIRSPCGIRLR